MKRVIFIFACCAMVVGCGEEAERPRPEPIVVYAPGDAGSELATLFTEFTEETRIRVSAKWGTSGELTDALINKTGIPADVLITDNLADIWRASDDGALRPAQATSVYEVPAGLRDADGYWVVVDVRLSSIATTANLPGGGSAAIRRYEHLGEPKLDGRVCVSAVESSANLALLAMLIDDLGTHDAERAARRWMRNLARPPYDDDAAVLAAIKESECDFGIVSRRVDAPAEALPALEREYFDARAMGVGRHAMNAESAHRFVEWMLQQDRLPQRSLDQSPLAAVVGYRAEEARQLAERIGWR